MCRASIAKSITTAGVALLLVALVVLTAPVPVAATVHEPIPALQQTIYTVRAGDTLSAIARQYGTTVQAIMAANGLTSTRIYVGQRLVIPDGTTPQPVRYQVQWGDTLTKIAQRFGTTVQAIVAANGLPSTRIYAGQWLTIPTGNVGSSGPERIQFVSGATSATRQGTVQFPTRKEYVLRALAGQTAYAQVTSTDGSVNFSLQGLSDGIPLKRVENEDRTWSGTLPLTQDYLVQIATTSSTPVAYTFFVQIDPLPAPTATERIQFAPGAISTTRTGTLAPQQRKSYLLRALAGQQMYVTLTSASSQVNFSLQGVGDGQIYKRGEVGTPNWDMTLPATQDYRIQVVNFGDRSADYTLYVQVEP